MPTRCVSASLALLGVLALFSFAQDHAPDARIAQAKAALEKGDTKQAIALADQILQDDPTSAAAYAIRAPAKMAERDERGAIDDFTALLRSQPQLVSDVLGGFKKSGKAGLARDLAKSLIADVEQPRIGRESAAGVALRYLAAKKDSELVDLLVATAADGRFDLDALLVKIAIDLPDGDDARYALARISVRPTYVWLEAGYNADDWAFRDQTARYLAERVGVPDPFKEPRMVSLAGDQTPYYECVSWFLGEIFGPDLCSEDAAKRNRAVEIFLAIGPFSADAALQALRSNEAGVAAWYKLRERMAVHIRKVEVAPELPARLRADLRSWRGSALDLGKLRFLVNALQSLELSGLALEVTGSCGLSLDLRALEGGKGKKLEVVLSAEIASDRLGGIDFGKYSSSRLESDWTKIEARLKDREGFTDASHIFLRVRKAAE